MAGVGAEGARARRRWAEAADGLHAHFGHVKRWVEMYCVDSGYEMHPHIPGENGSEAETYPMNLLDYERVVKDGIGFSRVHAVVLLAYLRKYRCVIRDYCEIRQCNCKIYGAFLGPET